MIDEVWEYRIARLELKPGDIFVLKINSPVTPEQARRLADDFQQYVGTDCRVLVLSAEMDLSVAKLADESGGAG